MTTSGSNEFSLTDTHTTPVHAVDLLERYPAYVCAAQRARHAGLRNEVD